MQCGLWTLVLAIPAATYGGAGFSDDGAGLVLVLALLMAVLTILSVPVMAWVLLGRRWSAPARRRGSWSELFVWGAASVLISAVLGTMFVASSQGERGIAMSLADSATYAFGLCVGAFLSIVVLPTMLLLGSLKIWADR